jgi:hypothetical protein
MGLRPRPVPMLSLVSVTFRFILHCTNSILTESSSVLGLHLWRDGLKHACIYLYHISFVRLYGSPTCFVSSRFNPSLVRYIGMFCNPPSLPVFHAPVWLPSDHQGSFHFITFDIIASMLEQEPCLSNASFRSSATIIYRQCQKHFHHC